MLRNKLVILVVGLLFFVVVIYNLNFFLKKKSGTGAPQKSVIAPTTDDKSMAVGPRVTLQFSVPRDIEKWKRDPFIYAGEYTGQRTGENSGVVKPDDRGKRKAAGLKLEGVTVRDGKYFALVNGWVVEAGDNIDGVLITRVTRYSIFVKDSEGLREISIYNDIPDKEK
jgi:hypothetical protein